MVKGLVCGSLLALAGLLGCEVAEELVDATTKVVGSGNVVDEARAVSGFTGVSMETTGNLHLTIGATESLSLRAEDNLLPHIITEVVDGVLRIRDEPTVDLEPTETIEMHLTARSLASIELGGVGDVDGARIAEDELSIALSGVGDIELTELDLRSLQLAISGVGDARLSGATDTQVVAISGTGDVVAGGLASRTAVVSISGVGSATVHVTEHLRGVITGSGRVCYIGSPTVESTVTGQGTVEPCSGIVSPPAGMVPVGPGTAGLGDGVASCGVDQFEVTLTRPYFLSSTEVTNAQFVSGLQWAYDAGLITVNATEVHDNLDGNTGLLYQLASALCYDCEIGFTAGQFAVVDGGHGLNPNHPVTRIQWVSAAAFCDWRSLQEGLPRSYDHSTWLCNGGDPYSARGYRLPTGAEWEFALRREGYRTYAWGEAPPTCANATYFGCGDWTTEVASHPGFVVPGGWRLYDMGGNVMEWVNDWRTCALGNSPRTDPVGPATDQGQGHALRDGSYRSPQGSLRCSFRGIEFEPIAMTSIGFRIALTQQGPLP